MAERLSAFGLPLDHNALARIERGERGVGVHELLVIAAALDTSPDVLAFPGAERELVALTDELVEPAGRLRWWWAGRAPLIGTARSQKPSWPIRNEISPDQIRERSDHWLMRRPITERHAWAHDGITKLTGAVNEVVRIAGKGKLEARDRARMRDQIQEAVRVLIGMLQSEDFGDLALDAKAVAENRDAWAALDRLFHDRGRSK